MNAHVSLFTSSQKDSTGNTKKKRNAATKTIQYENRASCGGATNYPELAKKQPALESEQTVNVNGHKLSERVLASMCQDERTRGEPPLHFFPFPLSDTACMPALPISLISHTQSTIAS